MKVRLGLTCLLLLLTSDVNAQATPLVEDSPEAACEVLKRHMAKLMGLPGGRPFPRWFCDGPSEPANPLLYVFGLRTAPDPKDAEAGETHSYLVGWFAVARRSSLVFEYDINEDRLLLISDAYSKRPRTANRGRAARATKSASPRVAK
jgi:hypothetical protein